MCKSAHSLKWRATAHEPRGRKRSARPVGAVRALPKRSFGIGVGFAAGMGGEEFDEGAHGVFASGTLQLAAFA